MSLKINMPSVPNIGTITTPSKGYYDAQNRFQEILKNKLGVAEAPYDGMYAKETNSLTGMMNFNPSNVTELSGVDPSVLNERFKGTEFEGLGEAFSNAEKKYGINAWFLTGLAIHESDYGKSRIAQDKNNLFGFKAYDASPYKSASKYASKTDSIDAVARYLSEEYTDPSGKYYNGTSIEAIGRRYATDPKWAEGIQRRVERFIK